MSVSNDHRVRWPQHATAEQGEALAPPMQDLLRGLNLLGETADDGLKLFTEPSQAVAILEAGSTRLTRSVSAAIAAVGGVSAVLTAIKGFYFENADSVQAVLIAGSALVFTAMIIGIAWMVASDLRARGAGAAEIYRARTAVACAFLTAAEKVQGAPQSVRTPSEDTRAPAPAASPPPPTTFTEADIEKLLATMLGRM